MSAQAGWKHGASDGAKRFWAAREPGGYRCFADHQNACPTGPFPWIRSRATWYRGRESGKNDGAPPRADPRRPDARACRLVDPLTSAPRRLRNHHAALLTREDGGRVSSGDYRGHPRPPAGRCQRLRHDREARSLGHWARLNIIAPTPGCRRLRPVAGPPGPNAHCPSPTLAMIPLSRSLPESPTNHYGVIDGTAGMREGTQPHKMLRRLRVVAHGRMFQSLKTEGADRGALADVDAPAIRSSARM